MNKSFWSLALMLVSTFFLGGCAVTYGDGRPTYTPFANTNEEKVEQQGELRSYSLRERDTLPARVPVLRAMVELNKAKCLHGVKTQRERDVRRPNPDIDRSSAYRSLSAHVRFVDEIVADFEASFECNPKPEEKSTATLSREKKGFSPHLRNR